MDYQYFSNLKQNILDYYDFKESLGYKKYSYTTVLRQVDKYAFANDYKESEIITKEFMYDFLKMKETETQNGRRKRASVLNDFSKYLRSKGEDSFVLPKGSFTRYKKPMPYIYTDDELTKIFEVIDNEFKNEWGLLFPVLMRFYFTTGARPQEPLSIKCSEIDLLNDNVKIIDSKGHKDRIIAYTEELGVLLREYDSKMKAIYPNREYFFVIKGKEVMRTNVSNRFHQCVLKANLNNKQKLPRLYDWRHNFASRALQKMLEDKQDIDTLLVVLSEYMGHVEFRDTYYYISLLPGNLIETGKLDWDIPGDIYE